MRILPRLVLTALLLAGCALPARQTPAPRPAAKPPTPWNQTEATRNINVFMNDTDPSSTEWVQRRTAIAQHCAKAALPGDLRLAVNDIAAFVPPHLAGLKRALQAADEADAAAAAARPQPSPALAGAVVEHRIGPAFYLIRLSGGDTAFLKTDRRLKVGSGVAGIPAVEQPRPKPNPAAGDLTDPGGSVRVFAEATPSARRRAAEKDHVRESQRGEIALRIERGLGRVDNLARSVNAILEPRLLPRRASPSTAALIPRVGRMAREWSRWRYYRYAVPETGRPGVDATLGGYLAERRAAMVGDQLGAHSAHGRDRRIDVDVITFRAFTAAPRLLSIRFEEQRDRGGLRPEQRGAAFTFDMGSQTQIGLSDIFSNVPAALSVLSELAGRRLTLALGREAVPAGYAPRAENFAAFVLDGGDIEFTFPAGRAAPRTRGRQTLRVPLLQPRLLPLLTPGFRALLTAAPLPAAELQPERRTKLPRKKTRRSGKKRGAGRSAAQHRAGTHHVRTPAETEGDAR